MTDTQKAMREFHAWNEDLSGNENQEICKYRMQGWMGHAAQSAEKIANDAAHIKQLETGLDKAIEKIARLKDVLNKFEYAREGYVKRYPEEEEVERAISDTQSSDKES